MGDMNAPTAPMAVGEVARLTGVTVRTLHHYDALGLLRLSGRSDAGYRLYSSADVARLGRVVALRRMRIALRDIPGLLDADPATLRAALLQRRDELRAEARGMEATVRLITRALEEDDMTTPATREDLAEIFGDGFDDAQAEAAARWGRTRAWQESQRRTAAYTRADWEAIKAEADANVAAFLDAMTAGTPPEGPAAMRAAEDHRAHVDRRFFACDHALQRNLADLYDSDPRYAVAYDGTHPGLSAYVTAAMRANAARATG